MKAPLSTNRQRYHHLYSLVCEDFPPGLVDSLLVAGYKAKPSVLLNVRNGRSPQLEMLIDLVKRGIPHFQITEDLLPLQSVHAPLFLEQE